MAFREFRPPTRKGYVRDAKLIIIATEGEKTEPEYFELLRNRYKNSRVYVEVLSPLSIGPSPNKVFEQLKTFAQQYNLRKGDELWMVIDRDKWKEKMLGEIAKACQQKKFQLAVSNPCFEFWLLLHVQSLEKYTTRQLEHLKENKRIGNRTVLEKELVKLLGSYQKDNPTPFIPYVYEAVNRAEKLDRKAVLSALPK